MNCPRDNETLEFQGYWKHPRHQCGSCGGLLVSESDVMEALGHQRGNTMVVVLGIQLAKLPQSPLLCPREGKAMRVIVHEGVELDMCPACRSVWLDPGEYAKIAAMRKKTRLDVDPVQAGYDGDLTAGDFAFDGVLEFVGEAVGALFDGL